MSVRHQPSDERPNKKRRSDDADGPLGDQKTENMSLAEKMQLHNAFAQRYLDFERAKPNTQQSCAACWFPRAQCCCHAMRAHRFQLQHVRLVIFMHYQEFYRRTNTTLGFVLANRADDDDDGAGDCTLLTTGNADDEATLVRLLREHPGDVGLLFPSSNAITVPEFCNDARSASATASTTTDTTTNAATTKSKKIIVVPDGTWGQVSESCLVDFFFVVFVFPT